MTKKESFQMADGKYEFAQLVAHQKPTIWPLNHYTP